ncbi:hypothetical protein K493DRAFT_365377 [Basidiobolus meristosporus CBS 931.73]|uniref:Uncharacterized protein n=1 Tax=Basidiobolus meristosporus CBS 931.73 TaxID=1314790 RepID=A0A1Y1VPI2_9FUNG|nr:hypothetical protein K493DRAFT_365377 [Basidiobolus meristosporus CBS 931.73]|eukprot:ORX62512.1 hypothetical protein K493DRAFT_365377 [Basidiobolus meristosporus CBS 931.73]
MQATQVSDTNAECPPSPTYLSRVTDSLFDRMPVQSQSFTKNGIDWYRTARDTNQHVHPTDRSYAASIAVCERNKDAEFFLTARNSQGTGKIIWSFYAAAVGAW